MTVTLREPAAPPKRTRAEWDEFIRQRQDLDAKRKEHNRAADALKKSIDAMDAEITAFVEHEVPGKEKVLTMKHFVLSVVWKPASSMAIAFAALKKLASLLGEDEFKKFKASIGPRKDLDILPRDAPAANVAA